MTEPDADTAFAALHGHTYARLTTFRKNGEGVASAMWFALEGGQLYIATPANTGKVKRLRTTRGR
ncbi:MAG: pyridoxamine 5'-phosphate oxidase family protein [Chloroflexia bacterium]